MEILVDGNLIETLNISHIDEIKDAIYNHERLAFWIYFIKTTEKQFSSSGVSISISTNCRLGNGKSYPGYIGNHKAPNISAEEIERSKEYKEAFDKLRMLRARVIEKWQANKHKYPAFDL